MTEHYLPHNFFFLLFKDCVFPVSPYHVYILICHLVHMEYMIAVRVHLSANSVICEVSKCLSVGPHDGSYFSSSLHA